ncbi:MAG TPA: NB-ARC domain-containing protein, partial [Thermomicrobiales bacterium]|nr:NB-ARC domain-containing protein [Thermomicrobiales bacterium]
MTSRRDSPAENVRPLDTTALPVPLASFVGRDAEIATVRAALLSDSVRLLTLIGPGGVGKTRLAVRAAEDMRGAFADGVVFVPLAAVRDPALVASEIAQTLGVPEVSGRPLADSLAWHLRDRSMLLLLDNFEQVLPAAPLINALLAAAPAVRVLVTSRSVLRLYGEYDILIPPLSLPDSGAHWAFEDATRSEAVRLFVERARAANSSFHLTAANTPVIAEVCRRLDGLPLAIELAAARITVLPLEAMLARMEQRLPLLT